jgi:hypothetical protein
MVERKFTPRGGRFVWRLAFLDGEALSDSPFGSTYDSQFTCGTLIG